MKNKETKIPTSGAAMYNVQEEHQTEEEKAISKREAVLLARKKRLQRQRVGNRPVPTSLKWERSCRIKTGMKSVKNVLILISSGRPANYVGVLCPSKLKLDG